MWKNAAVTLMGAALFASGMSLAGELHQRVSDFDVYYGLMPAQGLDKQSPQYMQGVAHGNVHLSRDSYHLTVTVRDAASGRCVEDARVAATVGELGLAGKNKVLEPMRINGTVTYGNYFVMKGKGPYRIVVYVTPRGDNHAVEATFDRALQ